MIITRLSGGLGNQMFIYSVAKCLAIERNDNLLLDDLTAYRNYIYKWTYGLDKFIFSEALLSQKKYSFIRLVFPFIKKLQERKNIFNGKSFYYLLEPENKKFIEFENVKSKILYLDGYWQNPAYFIKCSEIIRRKFQFKDELDVANKILLDKILSTTSVALHARQLRNFSLDGKAVSTDTSKILDVSYYTSAIKLLQNKVEQPHFYCFGDDPEWLIKNIQPYFPAQHFTPVINRGELNSHFDFILMKNCKHLILSNSTFVWWAAWLNTNKNKIIISPPIKYWDNVNIIPEEWIVL